MSATHTRVRFKPQDFGFGGLFAVMGEAVIVGDVETRCVVLWNRSAEELFGYSAEEATGLPIEDLISEWSRPSYCEKVAQYAATGRSELVGSGFACEVPARTKSGEERWVELTLSPLKTAPVPGRFVLAVVRDVTDRREAQARLALTADQLDVANRALREFMLIAAHDLANPLCAIRSAGQMLSSTKERSTSEVRNLGQVITRQVDHLLALLGELNELTKIEAGQITAEPGDVSVPALVTESLEAAGLSPGDVAVHLTDLLVWADRGHVHRILTNYLTNARRHAGGCGITITAHRNGDSVDICVVDTGPGVPPDFVPRLFDKFSRGPTANSDGTGLGLAIVADLAHLNGGTAWYEPNTPTGAQFWVRLPAHPRIPLPVGDTARHCAAR